MSSRVKLMNTDWYSLGRKMWGTLTIWRYGRYGTCSWEIDSLNGEVGQRNLWGSYWNKQTTHREWHVTI
jgi:hypothetical protein